jgi:hypothetical protein
LAATVLAHAPAPALDREATDLIASIPPDQLACRARRFHDFPILRAHRTVPKGITAVPQADGCYQIRETCRVCGLIRYKTTRPGGAYDLDAHYVYERPDDWVVIPRDLDITQADLQAANWELCAEQLFAEATLAAASALPGWPGNRHPQAPPGPPEDRTGHPVGWVTVGRLVIEGSPPGPLARPALHPQMPQPTRAFLPGVEDVPAGARLPPARDPARPEPVAVQAHGRQGVEQGNTGHRAYIPGSGSMAAASSRARAARRVSAWWAAS